ncbi:purple acid phosphatase 22-like [Rutidosis leptorrhynchoides]|uniref:purple acid phosphatase 22-like n=1 Tax=Rutidosis leptorrhynchoides TaxID=125765 RepID=UPI003A99E825
MTNLLSFLFLFLFVLISSIIEPLHSSEDYVRPPPRPVVITHHNRPASHPQQVHVSLVGKNHMKVSWVTEESGALSTVDYGKTPGKYDSSATGERSSNYHYFLYSSGDIHHVTIGPLDPATTYYYRCGGSGPEFNFRTPPTTFPIEFVVVGDLGQTEWTNTTLEHINAKDYDVLLLPGDLSYADTQQPLWDSFGRLVEPYASRRPWMVTEGNHEQEIFPIIYPKGFKAYNERWPMPYEQSGSKSNLYYSFDVVGTHIIMLGSYADFGTDSDQYKWLANDLAKIDRSITPWVIVLLHAPWYNSNTAHQGEGESMRLAMEEMLYNARVDIVFSGHVHAYERFTRVYNNNADPCGPMYITIGDGGNREGLAMSYKDPQPEISEYREASFGHGRLRILNETDAHWSWNRNDDSVSSVADDIWFASLSSTPSCIAKTQQKPQSKANDEL